MHFQDKLAQGLLEAYDGNLLGYSNEATLQRGNKVRSI